MSEKLQRTPTYMTYDEMRVLCIELKSELSERGISYHSNSALGQVLRSVENLARDWENGERAGYIRDIINASHARRIADACIAASTDPGANECLRRVIMKNTNLAERVSSQGKDALWELELSQMLKRRAVAVQHVDPPDLICSLCFGKYPIACKKVYSEKGVEAQVRKGAQQLHEYGLPGLVALNLDDLVPADSVLQSPTFLGAMEYLHSFNADFIRRNQLKMQRFLKDGRCDAILISTATFADIRESERRFNSISTTTLWTIETVSLQARERIRVIGQLFDISKPVSK
jgi:hypothetical protein